MPAIALICCAEVIKYDMLLCLLLRTSSVLYSKIHSHIIWLKSSKGMRLLAGELFS